MAAIDFFAWTARRTSVNDPAGINRAASVIVEDASFAGSMSAF
jgi:hypothetical protein